MADDARLSYLTAKTLELKDMPINNRESVFSASPMRGNENYASLDRDSVLETSGTKANLLFSYNSEIDDSRIEQGVDRLRFYADKYNSSGPELNVGLKLKKELTNSSQFSHQISEEMNESHSIDVEDLDFEENKPQIAKTKPEKRARESSQIR